MAEKRKKTQSGSGTDAPMKKQQKLEKKASPGQKATSADAKKLSQESPPLTDEERKKKKNQYIRKWRKAHKEEYAAYMKAWREKRAKGAGGTAKRKTTTKKTAQEPAAPEPDAAAEALTA